MDGVVRCSFMLMYNPFGIASPMIQCSHPLWHRDGSGYRFCNRCLWCLAGEPIVQRKRTKRSKTHAKPPVDAS